MRRPGLAVRPRSLIRTACWCQEVVREKMRCWQSPAWQRDHDSLWQAVHGVHDEAGAVSHPSFSLASPSVILTEGGNPGPPIRLVWTDIATGGAYPLGSRAPCLMKHGSLQTHF